ncbi:MAG: glycerol-3-phosphate dehydrogenase [Burkholderiales bacterium]|jgi:glycerol-3-phosphate dehydrogenase (NAD(P)+)|nr:glycerol-3-phosphate dehydrogenase [Burkholderiales bacterium]
MQYKVCVLGAGSWGSALAIALNHVMHVTLWGRDKDQIKNILASKSNVGYLPLEIKFPDSIQATSNLDLALQGSDLVLIATPLSGLRDMFLQIKSRYNDKLPDIIWVCKGLEVGSGLFPHEIARETFGKFENIGALLGPSFANEVAQGLPTAITLSSSNTQFAKKWISQLNGIPNFRVYANTDVIGSEVGGAIKNIMAIAVGISDGLQLGYNARAALMTRSLNELSAMVIALNGESKTIYGLSGIGDLILTCTGDLSRNRTVGLELAKGGSCEQILKNLGHVAEGVYAANEIYKLSKRLNVDMPIVDAVYGIIYENADIKQTVGGLLSRAPKFES